MEVFGWLLFATGIIGLLWALIHLLTPHKVYCMCDSCLRQAAKRQGDYYAWRQARRAAEENRR